MPATNLTRRQFNASDKAVDQAVIRFLADLKAASVRWDGVAASYVIQRALDQLCWGLPELIDDPSVTNSAGPATLKLSNAILDFRDAPHGER